jgi:hypothetical protein
MDKIEQASTSFTLARQRRTDSSSRLAVECWVSLLSPEHLNKRSSWHMKAFEQSRSTRCTFEETSLKSAFSALYSNDIADVNAQSF